MFKIIAITACALAISSCASVKNIVNAPDTMPPTPKTTPAINAPKGLVTMPSPHSVQDTADKLVAIIESKGMKIFARVDHQKNAQGADLTLRPTQVIMFGNPKVGTPLMNCEQSVAIDLPQKILISEDAAQKVWLSYNHPTYLKERHHLTGCDTQLTNIAKALNGISKAATAQ
ncbi:DUF302 domain-containing protein [Psychrobacter sp. CAM01]|uniref:DUF302 domain-containing protein n=1 Tax=Psychrobacter sp. CAM01 TaxID=3080335 RepID=UPI00293689CE|nr:DUF302 domain-containing protein [Psychrobacter sp. CAM01]MDV2860059.1 DUF302 domain-containing protein [Psychrobacter sp. CAM01]